MAVVIYPVDGPEGFCYLQVKDVLYINVNNFLTVPKEPPEINQGVSLVKASEM